VRESENVIWFEFPALCEGPRSAADYIAIASEYQSVIIANVPVFGADADNAARRFISVIDEFYDRGVNVIISAAAAPAELYKGEKLKFEFQRTASRLTEMQSEEYLARAHRAA
jgi:cell division protein ZapE